VSTFLAALKKYLPKTHDALETLAPHIGKRSYDAALKRTYGKLENISVDYAILERATREGGASRSSSSPRTSAGATSAPGLRS